MLYTYIDIFISLMDVRFANKESPWRMKQEQAYIHFVNVVDECEGMLTFQCIVVNRIAHTYYS